MKKSLLQSFILALIGAAIAGTVAYCAVVAVLKIAPRASSLAASLAATTPQNLQRWVAATTYSDSYSTGGALNLDNTKNNREGLTLSTNAGASATGSLMLLNVENPAWNKEILRIIIKSTTSRGLIRLDSPAPEIEYVETDQTAPAGKFETRVNEGYFQINSRQADDQGFEKDIKVVSLRDGGGLAVMLGDKFPPCAPSWTGLLHTTKAGELYFCTGSAWKKVTLQ
jgi:hypothetical protein